MEFIFTPEAWMAAGFIFILRVVDMTLNTLRFLLAIRGRKFWGWILGFTQAIIFVTALSEVFANMESGLSLLGYASGYATGTLLGISIEEKLAIGFIHLRIISPTRGMAIAEKLREEGYGATEVPGRGRDGTVSVIEASVRRREVDKVEQIIKDIDDSAMVTAEELRPLRRGYWRA